jgi:hypothetical protein
VYMHRQYNNKLRIVVVVGVLKRFEFPIETASLGSFTL